MEFHGSARGFLSPYPVGRALELIQRFVVAITLLPDLALVSGGVGSILAPRVVLVNVWLLRTLRRRTKLSDCVGDCPAPYLLGSTVAGKSSFFSSMP